MKRIGIHTITDYANYGNRLQNYAVQEILKSMGYQAISIVNSFPANNEHVSLRNRILQMCKTSLVTQFLKMAQKVRDLMNRKVQNEYKQKKIRAFRTFTRTYINETSYIISDNNVPADIDNQFDFCVTGSDQIWNPSIRFGSSLDFLTYMSPGKRIAVSPSFGVSHIPPDYKHMYREYLKGMTSLSVREERGAEIIFKLCGRIATVLVDPTLLLSASQWLAISKPAAAKPQNAYLLTYFIGDISKKRMAVLRRIAAIKQLEIVQLNSLRDLKRYDADPAEFIDYIRGASIVCTDSFHSSIFSMLMERPFVVFNREGKSAVMSSRLDTLLAKFKLQKRRFENIDTDDDYFNVDYSHVPDILDVERRRFIDYLNAAFAGEKEL